MFWLTFTVLGLGADFVLPMWWALGATIPIFVLSWWVACRSDWFQALGWSDLLRLRRASAGRFTAKPR